MARYELLDRIGAGGMAEIFRGKAVAAGGFEKPVAIKRILPHLSQDQRFVELLIAEAKILSELRHRNVVQIYDVGLGNDGQYFLVMEFVDGADLKALYDIIIHRKELPVEVALHICSEICEALHHAHIATDEGGNSLGLVHRDVSPSNVLLSRSGEIKLTDFGIAKRVEEATGHGAVRGKFAYISPEQAFNKHVDARSDVYSVGILLYEMAVARRLFSSLPDFDALRAVRGGQVKPPRHNNPLIDPALENIILKALARNPADRFQSAGEFGSALRGYRYSLETAIADPAAEIAALIARLNRPPSEDDSMRGERRHESTVVRIDTAAEFTMSGLREVTRIVSAFPEPRFDDLETGEMDAIGIRYDDSVGAMTLDELADSVNDTNIAPLRLDTSDNLDEETALGSEPTAHRHAPEFLTPAFDETDLGDAPLPDGGAFVTELPLRVAASSTGSNTSERVDPRPGFVGSALAQPNFPASSHSNPSPGPYLTTPGPNLVRPSTPTERDVFHGHLLPPASSSFHAAPMARGTSLEVARKPNRGRLVLAALAVTLGVGAFVVAGRLLASGDNKAAADAGIDAGSDAGIDAGGGTLVMPPDPVPVGKDDSVRKSKVRKGKVRKGKTRKGKGKRDRSKKGT